MFKCFSSVLYHFANPYEWKLWGDEYIGGWELTIWTDDIRIFFHEKINVLHPFILFYQAQALQLGILIPFVNNYWLNIDCNWLPCLWVLHLNLWFIPSNFSSIVMVTTQFSNDTPCTTFFNVIATHYNIIASATVKVNSNLKCIFKTT